MHKRLISTIIVLGFVVFLLFAISCEETERHKVLTFFFDGVPPIDGGDAVIGDAADPNLPAGTVNSKSIRTPHATRSNCKECHGDQKEHKGFSGTVQLTEKVPELCYKCHSNFVSSLDDWVHGPVAVGECLFCHNPHRSEQDNLLKMAIPQLCYQCHNKQVIESMPDHEEERSKCNKCHEGHSSSTIKLLKPDWER